jgi:FAD/FMN-containing dehydrogenase
MGCENMNTTALNAFKASFKGEIIAPQDPRYNEARAVYNGMIDKKPALIVRPRDAADVAAAVKFGRGAGLLTAIRGGGHNGPGLGSVDGGLVIDLSLMKTVEVDPKARTVRVGGGCTSGDVDAATSKHGLAVPTGLVSTTGIAGFTLGGGTGHLTRKLGLTIDSLLEAEVVLADGRKVTASAKENPDLLWALKGGGGNFGVVTTFLYRVHPVTNVTAGPIFYDVSHAREILEWYRDFLPRAPRELSPIFGFKQVPAGAPFPEPLWRRPVCALIICYNGPADAAQKALKPIREELPAPLMDGVAEVPFVAWQQAFDGLFPKGLQWYWKGDYVKEITDGAIAAHLEHGSATPSNISLMHLYPIDGAAQEVASDATAWGARDAAFSMVIAGVDPNPANAGKITRWAKDYWAALHPFNPGGGYVNFMMGDEDATEARLRASYGPNYDRLAAIKAKYDPENVFRVNQNIKPARAGAR